jgi:protein gp37
MADKSAIEWTDATWTPIRARNKKTGKVGWHCEHATAGCVRCYSEAINRRLGTGLPFKPGHTQDIDLFLDENMLLAPERWRKPRMIFVCSMTDLFADFVPEDWIRAVFAVMARTPRHTYQVLTKRAERMHEVLTKWRRAGVTLREGCGVTLPNVWMGVSVERQEEDHRLPYLINTPAAVRFLSAEPLLGPLLLQHRELIGGKVRNWLGEGGLNWAIIGGESGVGARECSLAWVRSLVDQCEAGGTACFVKQLGACVTDENGIRIALRHRKGADPMEWPSGLLVRQFPTARLAALAA